MPHPIYVLVGAAAILGSSLGWSASMSAPRSGLAIAQTRSVLLADGEDSRRDRDRHSRPQHNRRNYYFYEYNPHYSYSPRPYQYNYYLYPRPGYVFQYCSSGICFGG